jgi:hypothetical protein
MTTPAQPPAELLRPPLIDSQFAKELELLKAENAKVYAKKTPWQTKSNRPQPKEKAPPK